MWCLLGPGKSHRALTWRAELGRQTPGGSGRQVEEVSGHLTPEGQSNWPDVEPYLGAGQDTLRKIKDALGALRGRRRGRQG